MRRSLSRESRIGIDLDSNNRFQMLKTYFNASHLGKVEVYKTRKGFHVIVRRRTDLARRLEIRRMLGDDPERFGWDETKMWLGLYDWIDTLFNVKRHVDGRIYSEEQVNPFSEAWKITLPCRKTWRLKQK